MLKGFFGKIWLLGVFCSFFAIGIMFLVMLNYYLQREQKNILERNNLLVQVITHEIESGYLRGLWPYKTLKMVSDNGDVVFLWVVKPDGKVFWANEAEIIGTTVQNPFLKTQQTQVADFSFRKEKIKLIASPVRIELKEEPWVILMGLSLKSLKTAQKETIFLSVILLLLITFFISFIAYYFSRRITNPLKTLAQDLKIIGSGNLAYRTHIKTGDELEDLAHSFNQMAEGLQKSKIELEEAKTVLEIRVAARTKELQELNKSLEEKVQERTRELQERLNELERFHRLTVGRELKMIELKKELEQFKAKNKKNKSSAKRSSAIKGRSLS